MTAELLPRSYEEIISNDPLQRFLELSGSLKKDLGLAIIEDAAGTPILYKKGEAPVKPDDWEVGTPKEHLIGRNERESKILLESFHWSRYTF